MTYKQNRGRAEVSVQPIPEHLICFLKENSGLVIAPSRASGLILKGNFQFRRTYQENDEIFDQFDVKISVASNFPKSAPVIEELGGRIPRTGDYHVNPDGTLCLGSPIRLLKIASEHPTLSDFIEICLVPHLYASSYKLQHGGNFIFGELAHGNQGEIEDYEDLFQLKGKTAVLNALKALGTKKRISNKKPCPCGCGLRLGRCRTHLILNTFRKLSPRSFFRKSYQSLKA